MKNLLEIKDIAGLSEPLKRLIEVVAEGIGGISKPILLRKNADAKAYEIRTVAAAIAESQKLLGPVKYDAGQIIIESEKDKRDIPQLPDVSIEKRVTTRVAYQEAKKQSNIENITQYAAEEISQTEKIGDERPDSDWTARFFKIAEDITTEQMQTLWGKVLAGEVKRPGSFSLRTLDILKNISQKEAEIFVRLAHMAFRGGNNTVFVPNPDREEFLKENCHIEFLDLLLLREIGLLAPNDLEYSFLPVDKDTEAILTCGATCIFIHRPAGTPKQPLTVVVFTEIGKQLLQLVEPKPADASYLIKFASFFKREGIVVKAGDILSWNDDGRFNYGNIREVAENKPKT